MLYCLFLKIKIERSGGIAGMISSKEINTDNLPSAFEDTLRRIITKKTLRTPSSVPKGAADHINYKIIIEDGDKSHTIECSQYDTDEKLKALISYVEKNSNYPGR